MDLLNEPMPKSFLVDYRKSGMAHPRKSFASTSRFAAIGATTVIWIGVICLAVSAFAALWSTWSTRSLLRSEATVIENVATQDATGNVLYVAHLRFRTSTGETVTFTDPIPGTDSDSPDLATGTVVPVLYSRDHPESALIATVWRHYRTANILAILGIVFADTGLLTRLLIKRRNA